MAGAGRCSWSRTSLLWPTSLLALPSGRRPLWDYKERFHMRGADRHPICETTGDNMAGSVNKVILIGNLGAEPEVRSFQNGGKVCNIRIATSESWKDRNTGERKDRTEWHTVAIFSEGRVNVAERFLRSEERRVGTAGVRTC